ncbi:cation:proton antiporter domain-containing protein [Streptomyces mirabilis]|uniref:cation:proton antiporter domain-containing protein n=1 Tax=Streptomyces mirabilis TaxID=68239 RepID=UPI0036B15F5E
MAIEAVTDERPCSWSGTALALVESYAGGIVIGAAIALLLIPVRRRPPEPLLHSVLSVATPLLACLSAELLHVSGVLAVVTCGLVTTRFGPRVIGSDARIQVIAFWEVAGYLLNTALFILVGIQLPAAVGALTSLSLAQAAIAACAVSVAVIGTRLLWFYSVLVRSGPGPASSAAGPPNHRPSAPATGIGGDARSHLAGRGTDRARRDRRRTCRRATRRRRAPAPGSIRRRESVRRLEPALLQVERDTLRDLRDAGRI